MAIGGSDNFASTAALDWQVHVYGRAKPELSAWCDRQGIPLHEVKDILRHSSISVTKDIYGHTTAERMRAAIVQTGTTVIVAESDRRKSLTAESNLSCLKPGHIPGIAVAADLFLIDKLDI